MKNILKLIAILCLILLTLLSCDNNDDQNQDQADHSHEWTAWSVVNAATCTQEGLQERSCSCGEKEQEKISTIAHIEVIDEAVAPTCTQTGLTEGKHCSFCGDVLVAQTVLDKASHTEVVDKAVAATCTTTGLTEGKHCSVCNEVLIAQTVVDKTPHTEVVDKAVAATCMATGLTEGKHCSVCKATLVEQTVVDKTPHTESIDAAVAATCISTGLTEGKHCSVCDAVLVAQSILPMVNHTYDDENDEKCNVCDFIRDVACKHTNVIKLAAVAPTCTSTGLTEGKKCAKCQEILVAQTIVKAKGHTEVIDKAVAATCTTAGKTEGKHCSVCNTVLVAQTTVKAKGHTEVIDKAVAATCTADGKTEGKHCSVCNEVLAAQETIKAKGHKYTEGICYCGAKDENYIPPTTYSDGLEYELSNDGAYYIVSSIGQCTDTKLVIPSMHKGVPVKEIGEAAFYECASIENVILPEGIVSIGKSAFSDCDELVSITLPKTLQKIGDKAFAYSSELKSISIPEGVTIIGTETFRYCYSLENVVLPDSVIEIGLYAFCYCDIVEIDLPNKLEIIGDHAFYLCKKLQEITIPETVSKIGKYAFWDCESLTKISIEDGVKAIDPYAFYGCTALTDISIPNSIESIGTYAFSDCEKLKTIILPQKLKTIGIAVFSYCSALENITIPENITSIENLTFSGCKSLVSIYLPNSVKTIGNSAFYGCEALVEINIPSELRSVGDSAFQNCKSLKSLVFPKTLQSFSKMTTQTPFSGCSALENIAVHIDNPYYLSYKNCIIERATGTVILGIGDCELPNDGSVKKIADDALRNLDVLTSVRIPDGTVSIGNRVFYDCNNLKEIIIPKSVQTIGYYAFMKCNSLETIIFMGTEQEWANITKGNDWDGETVTYTIQFLAEEVPVEKTYTVIFKDYDGTILSTQSVKEGNAATAPTSPSRTGYRFTGWDKAFNNVTSNITVTAQYVQTFTVTFKDHNGSTLKTQTVDKGAAATAPANPSRDGYTFKGWDKAFNNVTSNITVTAVYEKLSTSPQFVVSDKEAKRGETIEVTIALKNNPGIASIIMSVAYDSNALTLTEVTYNSSMGGQTVQPQTMSSPVKLYWINGFANTNGDVVFVTLKFTVKNDAALGDHDITLSYNADDVYDISETNLPFEIVNGKITINQ